MQTDKVIDESPIAKTIALNSKAEIFKEDLKLPQRSSSPIMDPIDWGTIPVEQLLDAYAMDLSLDDKKSEQMEAIGDQTREIMEMICNDDEDFDIGRCEATQPLDGNEIFDLGLYDLFASLNDMDDTSAEEDNEVQVREKRRPPGRDMLLTQAIDVDGESTEYESDDEIASLKDFIDDRDTHMISQQITHTQMHAEYLQSLISPINTAQVQACVVPAFKNTIDSEAGTSDAYIIDSFCVDSDSEIIEQQTNGESEEDSVICIMNTRIKRRKIARISESDDENV
ncbi:hypothetical protein ACOME3_001847 [Neoechinorhynchus agilis]